MVVFFFKQKTAYEIVSRDWSSDVCSSDLPSDLLLDFFFIPAAYVISVSSVFSSSFSLKHRHLVEKYIVIIEFQFMTIDFGPYNNSIQYWYFTRSCQQGLNAQAIDNSIVYISTYCAIHESTVQYPIG